MFAFFNYIGNITYYLMFVALIGMLAPGGKYKKFVSLVMGFTLLGVMVAPLARFAPNIPVTDWFTGIETEAPTITNHTYDQWRNTYLRSAFATQLSTQLTTLLESEDFTVHDLAFTFPEDLGGIETVTATLSRTEAATRLPFIRIQPIEVSRGLAPETCETTTAAKNLISQFYNLPMAHIHVIVR